VPSGSLSSGPQQSIAETQLKALKADPEFRDRYLAGGAKERLEMRELLHAIAAADDNP
jgi:hypothetical protein